MFYEKAPSSLKKTDSIVLRDITKGRLTFVTN